MIFKVSETWDGKLMREFLRNGCRISRNTLCILKKCENGILLNGKCVTVRAVVHVGDSVELAIEDKALDENPNLYYNKHFVSYNLVCFYLYYSS